MRSLTAVILSFITFVGISANLPAWGGPSKLKKVKTPSPSKFFPKRHAVMDMLHDTRPEIRLTRRAHMYEVATSYTPAKKNLNARLRYLNEIKEAGRLYDHIRHTGLLSNTFPHLRRSIEKTIVNKTLRASLLKHMEEGHRSSMLHELEDYYHLTPNHVPLFYASMEPAELFARHALEYLQNHPHKPNWPLRHILKTEGIDPALKEEIRDVFNKGVVPPNRVNHILQVLQTVYLQYQHILKESEADGTVQATVAIYQYLADELETFTTTHKRLPEFRFEEEREFYNLLNVLAYFHEANRFEKALPQIRRLYTILERFPTPFYDEAGTIKELNKFIEKYNDFPQSVEVRDLLQPREHEDMLYTSIEYWKRKSPAFQKHFNDLFLRRTIKTEHLPPPFNYY